MDAYSSARCAVCGGGMGVIKRTHGRHRVPFYGCIACQKRGTTVCANKLVIRMEHIDDAVLTTISVGRNDFSQR